MKFAELSQDQIEYLKTFDGKMRKEAHASFNEKYGESVPLSTMKSWLERLEVKASGSGRFDGTQKPWAKGLPKEEFWSRYSEESKERMLNAPKEANRTAKVGNVRIKDGVPYITISTDINVPKEQRREPLRRFIWKHHNGEIPDDHMIIHLNGNRLDCRIENLAMIPKSYRPVVMRNITGRNADITKGLIMCCELESAVKKLR